ncbi:hypothetical protein, partial [Alteromonas australica]|uniref:hypothetical protein n=1 Tax=Alteromonas australica TaxID=589873 RepID=UPI002493BD01
RFLLAYQPIPAIAHVYVFLLPSVKSPLVKSTEAILRSSTAGKRRSKMIAYFPVEYCAAFFATSSAIFLQRKGQV